MNDEKPLSGIRVIELSSFVSGPMTARMLADMGAEVIKVEAPAGDAWRNMGAMWGMPCCDEENAMFHIYNAGKKSAVINLKTETGLNILYKLLDTADIFITNNRTKALQRLGIDYETIKKRFERLIYAQITGYGEKGPLADKPSFDTTAFWSLSGFVNDMHYSEAEYPVKTSTGFGDSVCSFVMLNGILAALYRRTVTGKGDFVTTSLYNTALWVNSSMIIGAQERYKYKFPRSLSDDGILNTVFQSSDEKWVAVMIFEPKRYFDKYIMLLGLSDNPIFSNPATAWKNKHECYKVVSAVFKTKTAEEWVNLLQSNDIACSAHVHFSDVEKNEQTKANEYLDYVNGKEGKYYMPADPIRFGSYGKLDCGECPVLGGDTTEVISSLGYDENTIADIFANGAAIQHE